MNTIHKIGVMLDQKLTFTNHVNMVAKKIKQARARMNCLIGKRIKLLLKTKLRLIQSVIIPIVVFLHGLRIHLQDQQEEDTNATKYQPTMGRKHL